MFKKIGANKLQFSKKSWLILVLLITLSTEAHRGGRSWKVGTMLKDGSYSRPLNALRSFVSLHRNYCKSLPVINEKGSYIKSCSKFKHDKSLSQIISQLKYFKIEGDKFVVALTAQPHAELMVLKNDGDGISVVFRSGRPERIIELCNDLSLSFCKSGLISNFKKKK